ncbi:Nucleoside recognition [Pelagirhabdus alkalitolerans]|uniref:Nucleoside recognition n=1 Tax=Pelagirhabdus alkalitolerans TaxID=1612202 RepID=A0A1G6MUD6_9BACI|nr:nucleoside recognition domain-containing protein [Pelagirhabdus alkalitolerans]SDC59132.1 Nucleoside recognition [Pelagirhabdus alkalitolerans]
MIATLKRGVTNGFGVTFSLAKVIFPVTVIVSVLQFTPFLDWIVTLIAPFMEWFGLPGEAAVPLVVGNSLNLYAGIGAIVSFEFTVKEVFALAVMLSFSHNLFVESTVATRVGVRFSVVIGIRLALAFLSAWLIHLLYPGGEELAQFGSFQTDTQEVSGVFEVLVESLIRALSSIGQLALIVIPLMIIMQLFREWGWLDMLSEYLAPFTKLIGIKPNASMTLVAGLTIGLAFGAGVMVQAIKEDGVEKKDMYLSFIFLVACHAVIEDTLIFIPLGIPVWPLLIIRVTTAILLTSFIAFLWNRAERKQREEAFNYGH